MTLMPDVAVVGSGPAGTAAALAARRGGASVLVLERAEVPRYKCCGGGLVGVSRRLVGAELDLTPLVRDRVTRMTFTKAGRQRYTRRSRGAVFETAMRADLDAALLAAAVRAGAEVRTSATVQRLTETADGVRIQLSGGETVEARVVVGADGTGGRSWQYVGVAAAQVDVGLEGEFAMPPTAVEYWHGRVHIDWGPVPGSYGWVFPKGDLLTVGVIGARERGDELRAYYRDFVERVGLGGTAPVTFAGHLTRCRQPGSPLRRGRVLVAGDAAGLLEPWTREGISFALRSGSFAGTAAAAAVGAGASVDAELESYVRAVEAVLEPEMAAGRRFLAAFTRNRQVFHGFLASVPGGWRLFARLVAGETTLAEQLRRPPVRAAIAALRG